MTQHNEIIFRAFELRTARLAALVSFLVPFAPAIGEKAGYDGIEVDSSCPDRIIAARNRALAAAFEAVRGIALESRQRSRLLMPGDQDS